MNYYGGYGSGYGGYGGYDRYGGFDFDAGSMSGAEAAIGNGFMLVVVGLVYVVLFAYLIVNYVIRAIGLYRIAKQNGTQNPWLAWVPYADLYLLAKITGDVSLGKRRLKNTGLWLILIPIGISVLSVSFIFGFIMLAAIAGFSMAAGYETALFAVVALLLFVALILILCAAELLYYIIYGMTYYTLCTKFKESTHSVFYTLMALFVPLADAIIMLKLSKMAPVVSPTASPYNYEPFNNDTTNMGE